MQSSRTTYRTTYARLAAGLGLLAACAQDPVTGPRPTALWRDGMYGQLLVLTDDYEQYTLDAGTGELTVSAPGEDEPARVRVDAAQLPDMVDLFTSHIQVASALQAVTSAPPPQADPCYGQPVAHGCDPQETRAPGGFEFPEATALDQPPVRFTCQDMYDAIRTAQPDYNEARRIHLGGLLVVANQAREVLKGQGKLIRDVPTGSLPPFREMVELLPKQLLGYGTAFTASVYAVTESIYKPQQARMSMLLTWFNSAGCASALNLGERLGTTYGPSGGSNNVFEAVPRFLQGRLLIICSTTYILDGPDGEVKSVIKNGCRMELMT